MAGDLLTGDKGLAEVMAFQKLWRGAELTVTHEELGITARLVCFDRDQREMGAKHEGVSLRGDAPKLGGDILHASKDQLPIAVSLEQAVNVGA